jgi:hypothetical protein
MCQPVNSIILIHKALPEIINAFSGQKPKFSPGKVFFAEKLVGC